MPIYVSLFVNMSIFRPSVLCIMYLFTYHLFIHHLSVSSTFLSLEIFHEYLFAIIFSQNKLNYLGNSYSARILQSFLSKTSFVKVFLNEVLKAFNPNAKNQWYLNYLELKYFLFLFNILLHSFTFLNRFLILSL